MTQQQTDLRRYIEMFDREIFKDEPTEIEMINRKYMGADYFAAYLPFSILRKVVVFLSIALSVFLLYPCIILLSPFWMIYKTARRQPFQFRRRIAVQIKYTFVTIRWYFFKKSDRYGILSKPVHLNLTTKDLVGIAAHEVRHRVQYKKNYSGVVHKEHFLIYDIALTRADVRKEVLHSKQYKPWDYKNETDAYLVQRFIYSELSSWEENYGMGDESIAKFIRSYAPILQAHYED